jgi:hypothetical protein
LEEAMIRALINRVLDRWISHVHVRLSRRGDGWPAFAEERLRVEFPALTVRAGDDPYDVILAFDLARVMQVQTVLDRAMTDWRAMN